MDETNKRESGLVETFYNDSTIQSLKFVGSKELRRIERIFWWIVVIICIIFSAYLIHILYVRYRSVPVIISFRPKEISIQQIAFPAITICNVNIFKRSVLEELLDELYYWNIQDPDDPSTEYNVFQIQTALEHIAQFCLTTPNFRRKIGDILCDVEGHGDHMDMLYKIMLSVNASTEERLQKLYKKYEEHLFTKTMYSYYQGGVKCEEMIAKCTWSGNEIPCKEIFFTVDTRQGRCCGFNMMPKFLMENLPRDNIYGIMESRHMSQEFIDEWKSFRKEDMILEEGHFPSRSFPKHQAAGGKQYGLSIIINPQIHEYSTCTSDDGWGFMMHAHSPMSMPNVRRYGSAIPINSEVFVEVDPYLTDADVNEMKRIEIEHRECYIPLDKESQLKHHKFYTAENCLAECIAYHEAVNCSCIHHHLPNDYKNVLPCRAKQSKCADAVLEKLMIGTGNQDFCSHCRSPCTELEYGMAVHHFELQEEALKFPVFYNDSDENEHIARNYSIVHIYFGSDSLYIRERKPLYNIFRFISDAGGLFGLTLGISIVSFIEFFYFATLRLYFHYKYVTRERGNRVGSTSRSPLKTINFKRKTGFKFDSHGILKFRMRPAPRKNSIVIYPFLK